MLLVRPSVTLATVIMAAAVACSTQSAAPIAPATGAAPTAPSAGTPGSSSSPASALPAAGSGAVPARPVAGAVATASMPVMPNSSVTPADLDAGIPEGPVQGREPPSTTRCADVPGTPSSSAGSGYPGGRWTVPADAYTTVTESNVTITMSDGVALVGDIAYPADLKTGRRVDAKFPVLLTQNPYGAAAFGAGYGELFVKHGYIFASVDVRGTGRSAGTHDMFAPREAEDGAALVAWAAKLEGSDGRVGLQGCSQLGINQLETASLLGPDSPVKAMIPACASGDFYRDTAFDNGIPTIVGSLLAGAETDLLYYREYWKTRDRLARAPAIARANIPMLLWSGWHEPGALGSLELYTALQNLVAGRPVNTQITADTPVNGRVQVILGDWAHAGGLDLGIQLQWYDTWIKGMDTGLPTQTKTPLHLAELGGSKRWINSRCYPLVEQYTPLYLAGSGKLASAADAAEGKDMLKWVAPGSTSQTQEYVSEPFAEGAQLAGPLAARLRVSSSNANLQLLIEVFDRAPDGKLARLSQGSVLGSLRRADPEQSWKDSASLPKRPRLTLDEDQPLTAGEATPIELPLWPTLWSIEPRHSLLVRISTQPSSDNCQDPLGVPVGCYPSDATVATLRGGTYSLHRGGMLGSLISVPLTKHGAFATATSAVSPTADVKASSADARPLPIDW